MSFQQFLDGIPEFPATPPAGTTDLTLYRQTKQRAYDRAVEDYQRNWSKVPNGQVLFQERLQQCHLLDH